MERYLNLNLMCKKSLLYFLMSYCDIIIFAVLIRCRESNLYSVCRQIWLPSKSILTAKIIMCTANKSVLQLFPWFLALTCEYFYHVESQRYIHPYTIT